MEKRRQKLDDEAAAATNLTEMMYLKMQQGQSSSQSQDAAMRLCLGRQLQLPSSPSSTLDATSHIRVGSYYEIDHSKLPTKTPDQLKSVRVIMVSKKSKSSLSVRYPSVYSLRAHFRERNRRKPDEKMLPSLDEQYALGSELAGDVLYRRIPPHELALRRNQWEFWVGKKPISPSSSPAIVTSYVNVVSKKGLCWYELKSMVQWGQRRQVRFLGSHMEERRELSLSRAFEGEEEEKGTDQDDVEEDDDDDNDDEGKEKEVMVSDEENKGTDHRKSCKRKPQGASYKTQMKKKLKNERQNQQITLYKPKKEVKNSVDRWSFQRYNLAAKNMLKIMKEKGAVYGNPILRPALRAEARRLIGDTGLLDHLLKHMAGEVAPGGEQRFMRRHNADGAMEYWLESADLMDIRKEAGVKDPYWTPPPGWKLGDNPTQDPVCAKELKELREEIAKLKEAMQENKKTEEDVVVFTTPNVPVTSQNMVPDTTLLLPLKEKYVTLMNLKAKVEGQLEEIAQSLSGLEDEMGKLKAIVEDPVLILGSTTPPLGTERETKEMEKSNKMAPVILDEEDKDSSAEGKNPELPRKRIKAVAITEDKEAKIERQKSGFRICKPQGTFLWPNMALSTQVVVPTNDSVCSSTTTALCLVPSPQQYRPQPNSTVKPLAEKRSSTVAINFSPTPISKQPPPLPLEATSSINLNEVPDNPQDHGFCGSQNQKHSSPCSYTYQRRNPSITSTSIPRMIPAKKDNETSQCKHPRGYSSPSSHSLAVGAGTWLVLSTPSSSMDNNPRRV